MRSGGEGVEAKSSRGSGFSWWFVVCLVLATALATGLRVYKMGEGSFWNDELHTVTSAVRLSGTNVSKMLGYVPTRLGIMLAGIDPSVVDPLSPESWKAMGITREALRWPHVVIGVVTVPLVMLAARRVIGPGAACVLGVLVAVSCWHIYWSQASRFYVLQGMFYGLAVLLWYDGTRRRAPVMYVLSMACAFLAFWSQPVALMVFGVFWLDWVAARLRREPLAMRRWQGVLVVMTFALAAGIWATDWIVRKEQWAHFFGEDRWLSPQEVLLGVTYFVWPATAAFAGLAGLELVRRSRSPGVVLCAAAAGPPLAFACIAMVAFTGSRYAFMCVVPVLAVAAWGVVEVGRVLREKGMGVLALAPGAALLAGQLLSTAIYFRSGGLFRLPMDQAAAYLVEHRGPGEIIYAHEPLVIAYEMEQGGVERAPRDPAEIEAMTEPAWFVLTGNPATGVDRRMLARGMTQVAGFRLLQVHSKADVRVFRYEPVPALGPVGEPAQTP